MKTKVKKTEAVKVCEHCAYLKRYYPDIPLETLHEVHQPKAKKVEEDLTSDFTPRERSWDGKKVVRNPVNQLTATEEQVPVDLLGDDDKSIGMWVEMLRDEHEGKDEYLTIGGVCSYLFAMRQRSYAERCTLASAVRRIYANDRKRERERDEQWLSRVVARQQTEAGDSAPAKSAHTAGADDSSTETPAGRPPAKKPGVIACIVGCLRGASKKNPVTKEDILKVLKEKFPEREPDAMRSTIGSQIPKGLLKEKGLKVRHTEDLKGWWLPKEDKS